MVKSLYRFLLSLSILFSGGLQNLSAHPEQNAEQIDFNQEQIEASSFLHQTDSFTLSPSTGQASKHSMLLAEEIEEEEEDKTSVAFDLTDKHFLNSSFLHSSVNVFGLENKSNNRYYTYSVGLFFHLKRYLRLQVLRI